MHFWATEIDPAHPLECTQAERYVLRRIVGGAYLAIAADDQRLLDVEELDRAHFFHTHDAALRAAGELNRLGLGWVDVVKIELGCDGFPYAIQVFER
ncbi:MAG: hypothetical protein NTV57_17705 [Cyanobacteria bacterium]|nr:hypothetical protein [Cyanobacteriota bacterium]